MPTYARMSALELDCQSYTVDGSKIRRLVVGARCTIRRGKTCIFLEFTHVDHLIAFGSHVQPLELHACRPLDRVIRCNRIPAFL